MTRDDTAAVRPILVAESGVRCEYCGEVFDHDDVPTTPIPSTVLYRCPACERWTEKGDDR